MKQRHYWLPLLMLAFSACSRRDGVDQSYFRDCLDDVCSIDGLSNIEAVESGMVTSYDRTGGNNDGSGNLGDAFDGRKLLVDLEGAGCVRRIWLTGMPHDAKLYFYFEGRKKPDLIKSFSDLRGKGDFPFVAPLSDNASADAVCYLPIPFRKGLKITADPPAPGSFFFYQVSFTRSESDVVENFSTVLVDANRDAILKAGSDWKEVMLGLPQPDASASNAIVVASGSSGILYSTNGPAELLQFSITPMLQGDMNELEKNAMLRLLTLNIYWNGAAGPSINVPLGDFFCNATRRTGFESLPVSSRGDDFISRFPMPFEGSVSIEIVNESSRPVGIATEVSVRALNAWDSSRGYLHAAWGQTRSPGRPHMILSASGKGRYLGCYLVSVSHEPSWNILEGDELIYRDGEALPSFHGTGLEDYFNGAWYYSEGLFSTPLAGVLERSGIKTAQYRFHAPDPICFESSIMANIEFGHGNSSRGYMSSVAYWYQEKPVPVPALPPAAARLIPVDPLERGGMMCEIFEKERLGHLGEAMRLCREYNEKFPGTREAELMALRQAAYIEELEGFEAARPQYSKFVSQGIDAAVRAQAEKLLTFHESSSNALFVVHANSRYRAYLDGVMISEGDNPVDIYLTSLQLSRGEHVLAVEADCVRGDPWFSACLRTHNGRSWTDSSWEVTASVGAGWKLRNDTGGEWSSATELNVLPHMGWFQFVPNGCILSQHKPQLISSSKGWKPGQRLYFRKAFVY